MCIKYREIDELCKVSCTKIPLGKLEGFRLKKKISTSTYSFEDLRQNNCIYVDKTKYLYEMIMAPKGQFFCARPRRFGKSLMISTLETLFQGKRSLFKDLFIEKGFDIDGKPIDYDWEQFPVIHINLAKCDSSSPEKLEAWLKYTLRKIAKSYDIEPESDYASIMFESLIDQLVEKTGKKVVLLLDEYDKPLTDNIRNGKIEAIRTELEGFYSVIKGEEGNLRFTFITGITKFSQVSIFSKLNNLTDISRDKKYAEMFGYTEDELLQYFGEYIEEALASDVKDTEGISLDRKGLLDRLKSQYDGFCFFPGTETLYNPVSVGKFFNEGCLFKNYWYDTATPAFLVELAREKPLYLSDSANLIVSESAISAFNVVDFQKSSFSKIQLMVLLLQTGYLTIDAWEPGHGAKDLFYRLRFPNDEVALSFDRLLVRAYTGLDEGDSMQYVQRITSAAFSGNTPQMIELLKTFFAGFSYQIDQPDEGHYQTIVYCIFKLCGMHIDMEHATNIGRIDAALHTGKHLYIIEFKFQKTAGLAIEQIEEKKYAEKFILPAREKGCRIHLLGINFSVEDRNIIDDYVEKLI